ncbi:MAG: phytoene/squalene synthase family protein [Verrucomicrobiales bacterium]
MDRTGDPTTLHDFEQRLGRDLLRGVSRSFYLSLRLLPAQVRGPISLAYLLARVSDTLADSGNVAAEKRREELGRFWKELERRAGEKGAIAGGSQQRDSGGPHEDCDAPSRDSVRASRIDYADFCAEHKAENELLRRAPGVLAWFWSVGGFERSVIRRMMSHIIEGQTEDIERTSIESPEQLDRYIFQVAGCVGQFWTRLCAAKLSSFTRLPVDELEMIGIDFGKGLQLINILRDVPRDAIIGRSYLPGVFPNASPETRWEAAQPWIKRCRQFLEAGRCYAGRIRGFRCRMAVWLPLLLGWETLGLIENSGPAAMAAPVKVPRRRMKWIMAQAAANALGR